MNDDLIKDKTREGLKIAAIGDLDNDQHIDLVTLNNDLDSFSSHFYNAELKQYIPMPPVRVDSEMQSAKVA